MTMSLPSSMRTIAGLWPKTSKQGKTYFVVGKRAGFTQNLGPSAIDRYLQERKARAVA